MLFPVGKFIYWFTIGMVATIAWQERKNLGAVVRTYRLLTLADLWRGALLALLTAGIASLAVWLAPDFLLWGWPSLFGERAGNILLSPATHVPTPSSMSVGPLPPGVATLLILMVTAILMFLALLFFIMPGIVKAEERMFRARAVAPWRMLLNSLLFGTSHLIIGIPVVIGLVLSFPGYVFSLTYRKAHLAARAAGKTEPEAIESGLLASGALHMAYNSTILGSIVVALVTVAVLALSGFLP